MKRFVFAIFEELTAKGEDPSGNEPPDRVLGESEFERSGRRFWAGVVWLSIIGVGIYVSLDRLSLQNEVFGDDIQLLSFSIEKEGLVILTRQPFIRGRQPGPAEILNTMTALGFERIPGIPANSEDCFRFYRRSDQVAAFDAHTGNYLVSANGIVVPIDLVMVRANDVMHDYTCRRIGAAKS